MPWKSEVETLRGPVLLTVRSDTFEGGDTFEGSNTFERADTFESEVR